MKTHKMRNLIPLFSITVAFMLLSGCTRELPQASFEYSISRGVCYCSNYSLYGENYKWTLTLPDGTTKKSTAVNPSFSCNMIGEYNLRLLVSNKYGSDDAEVTFTIPNSGGGQIGNAPNASFNLLTNNGNYVPATITAQNTSTNATSYSWTLTRPNGTISTSTATNPSFECTTAGQYTIKLVAYGANNTSSTLSKYFVLYTPEPTATAYTITWLRLEKIPMLDTDNSSWDTGLFGGADPDIKFSIQKNTNSVLPTTYYTSSVIQDVTSSNLPISWYNVNTSLELGEEYRIRILDDDGLDGDDIMADCILPLGQSNHGITSYTWTSTNGQTKFTIGLEWVYSKNGNVQSTQGILDYKNVESNNTAIKSIK